MRRNKRRVIQRLLRRFMRPEPTSTRLGVVPMAVRLPATMVDAAQSLVDVAAMKSDKVQQRMSVFDHEYVHPDIVRFGRAFLAEMTARNIPFLAFELYRSPERQATLLKQGVSRAGPGSSPHQYGCAIDLVSAVKYWDLSQKQWAVVGAIGKEIARKKNLRMVWGGDWEFYDPAHWQLEGWKQYRWAEREIVADPVDHSEVPPFGDPRRFDYLELMIKKRA